MYLDGQKQEWTPSFANCKLNDPSKETCNSPFSMSSLKQTTKPVSNTKSVQPVGFINKGNSCYANSILQILIVLPTLCPEQSPFGIKNFITYVMSYQD